MRKWFFDLEGVKPEFHQKLKERQINFLLQRLLNVAAVQEERAGKVLSFEVTDEEASLRVLFTKEWRDTLES